MLKTVTFQHRQSLTCSSCYVMREIKWGLNVMLTLLVQLFLMKFIYFMVNSLNGWNSSII